MLKPGYCSDLLPDTARDQSITGCRVQGSHSHGLRSAVVSESDVSRSYVQALNAGGLAQTRYAPRESACGSASKAPTGLIATSRPKELPLPRASSFVSNVQLRNFASRPPLAKKEDLFVEEEPLYSIENFNRLAKEGRATIQDAHHYLAISKRAIVQLPFKQRWEAASQVGGGHILRWLMDRPPTDFDIQYKFTNLIAWFAYAEGLYDFIMDWLKVATEHEAPHDRLPGTLARWRWARNL